MSSYYMVAKENLEAGDLVNIDLHSGGVFKAKLQYPVFIDEKGVGRKCIGYACEIPGIHWEWYLFEKEDDDIYFAYVMGDVNEWGSISIKELQAEGIQVLFDAKRLQEIMPPIGWTKREAGK